MSKNTLRHLSELLGIPHNDDVYVNPLRLALTYEFGKKCQNNYRIRAINRCLHRKIDFTSECNTVVELATSLLAVKCPVCGRNMKYYSASGTGQAMTVRWRCSKDKTEAHVDLPSESIAIRFKESE